ncbi:unnamed protein product [Peniophora sp. CBMAI 1063]|nr:unnamed protein product [Peniophora sp. CBMAI 1063]
MPENDSGKPQYAQPEDLLWDTYLQASQDEDAARPKNWEGSTTGILTFTGLFAATVAAFIVESYRLLSPDSGDQTVQLLSQLLVATANASSGLPVVVTTPEPFSTPPIAIATNALWFTSLLISLICALLSTLVQEWSRAYVQDINRRKVLHESMRERAFNHIYIRMGVNRYGMDQFVSWIVALVHLAVFLFACGLLVFLFPIDHVVAGITTAIFGIFVIIYCVASLLPLLDKSCPYRTPITYLMAFVYWSTLRSWFHSVVSWSRHKPNDIDHPTLRVLLTRQYVRDKDESLNHFPDSFLTDARSSFMWEHTFLHISRDNEEHLFKMLPFFIEKHPDIDALLSRLCADDRLIEWFSWYLEPLYLIYYWIKPSPTHIPLEIFWLVSDLSRRMFASEVEHYADGHQETVARTSSKLLRVIGLVSGIAEVDGPAQLQAQICLAHVRKSLLKLCLKASTKMPTLQEAEVSTLFEEIRDWNNFELRGRHPCAILPVLVCGIFSQLRWEHASGLILIPLHDDDCCRGWKSVLTPEGRAHVAACNTLTVIAHILYSTDEQRQHDGFLTYTATFNTERWLEDGIVMPGDDAMKMPSPEFVNVLRLAGLDEWLEPGSTFDTLPRDGPDLFLNTHHSGRGCINILRKLAECVNFGAYFDRAASAQRGPPTTLPILGTDNTFEHCHLAQPAADVSNESEPKSPHNARTSTIGVVDGNVESARKLLANSDCGAFALAAGEDAAINSQGDLVNKDLVSAAGTAAQLQGERDEEEMVRTRVPELRTVTIDRDRDAVTADKGASDGAATDTRTRADVNTSYGHEDIRRDG